jgi:hypothetical protein
VYSDSLGRNITAINDTETYLEDNEDVNLEINREKPKHMFLSHHQNIEQNYNIRILCPLKIWQSSSI